MATKNLVRCLLAVLAVAALAAPALAGESAIPSGTDLWKSFQGESYTSFAEDPLPAGFFCPGSPAFAGRIAMQGAPLATDPPGVLGEADTIVHRLDDAAFDAAGVATTRIQMMALSMAGVEPLEVGCATPYSVAASLDGEQPTTTMRIVREGEDGGSFAAPLHMNVKLVFTPLAGGAAATVKREIVLGPAPDSHWTTTAMVGQDAWGEPVRVDTDGDRIADAVLPQALPFATGYAFAATAPAPSPCPVGYCPAQCCHCTPVITPEAATIDAEIPNTGCSATHLHCVNCCKRCIVAEPDEPVDSF